MSKERVFLLAMLGISWLIACQDKADITQRQIETPVAVELPPGAIPSYIFTIDTTWQTKQLVVDEMTGKVYALFSNLYIAVIEGTEVLDVLKTSGNQIGDMAFNPQDGRLYTIDKDTDLITIFKDDVLEAEVKPPGDAPHSIAIDPVSGRVYVLTTYIIKRADRVRFPEDVSMQVTILEGTEIIATVTIDDAHVPIQDIVVDPVYHYAYVTTNGEEVIVIKDEAEFARYKVPTPITTIAVNDKTGDVYVVNFGRDPATLLSVETQLNHFREGKLLNQVNLFTDEFSLEEQYDPRREFYHSIVHPNTGDLYLIDESSKFVVVQNENDTLKGGGVVWGRNGSWGVAADALTGNVYVPGYLDDSLTVINGTEVIARLETDWYPFGGVVVNPFTGWVYVGNTNEGSVSIYGFE